jgi:hypothetical protein
MMGSSGGLRSVSGHSVQTTGAEAYGKAVWFWHPWLVSSWRRLFESNRVRSAVNPAAMEARGIRLQGERGISRQTTAQGRAAPAVPVCSCAFCLRMLHTRPRVPAGARHSLRPLISEGQGSCKPRARRAARMRKCIHVIVSEAKQSITPATKDPEIGTTRTPAPANEWQLRLRQSPLILDTPLLNPRP